jgi:esterase/lipase
MNKGKVAGEEYDIPIIANFDFAEANSLKRIVIAIHGYGTGKHSAKIKTLADKLKPHNIGLVALDLTCHGESDAPCECFRVENFLRDIGAVDAYIRKHYNGGVCFSASSFSGYLTLLYLNQSKYEYDRVVLIAPGVDMVKNFLKRVDDQKRMPWFLGNLQENDVFENLDNIKNELNIVYATKDSEIDNDDIFKLASLKKCNLFPVEGADHWFRGDGEMEKLIEYQLRIFTNS